MFQTLDNSLFLLQHPRLTIYNVYVTMFYKVFISLYKFCTLYRLWSVEFTVEQWGAVDCGPMGDC